MDFVDASEHYDQTKDTDDTPSLCTIIIDTNPRAWATLSAVLPISNAIANILVFVNAHLALSNANQVAIIASHSNRAVWLYSPAPKASPAVSSNGEDVEMRDAADSGSGRHKNNSGNVTPSSTSANKYPQFAQIEALLLTSLRELITSTNEADLAATTTQLSGALTLALAHINKVSLSLVATNVKSMTGAADSSKAQPRAAGGATNPDGGLAGLHSRILVLSVSDSSPAQYIPTMNAVFAAAHAHIAIDTLALHGTSPFLQQAAFITGGTFLPAREPRGLLTYLLCGFAGAAGSAESASSLVAASADRVDFRAACFCHRNVVDTGFVCSICLSIFCEVPEGAECLTCGTKLALGSYGARPAVVPRTRKKKKRRVGINGESMGREETGSTAGTPRPG